jgi:phosphate transport system permease protein
VPASSGAAPLVGALAARGPATQVDRAFRSVSVLAGLLVLGVLGLIVIVTTAEAWPAFTQEGIAFVTRADWAPNRDSFGALAFVYGTMLVSVLAVVIAVPVSLGIALFSLELAPPRLRLPIAYVMDLLAAIPSVVYGLWGIAVLAPALQPHFQSMAESIAAVPALNRVFAEPAMARSFLTAGLILAIMIIPIVTSLSREVLATVPRAQKEAAFGLGATRWEMIRQSMLPWARAGIVGAVMLGLGRAMGETIAVALVIGASAQITVDLFGPGDSMAAVIANQFGEAAGTHRAALIGLGAVLFVMTIVVNVAARAIVARVDARSRGTVA